MKIGVDLIANKGINGTEIYAVNLLLPLVKSHPETSFVLFVNPSLLDFWKEQFSHFHNLEIKTAFFKTELGLVFYQQALVPFISIFSRLTLIYSPSPFFSWLAPIKKIITIHDAAYGRFGEYRNIFSKLYISANFFLARFLNIKITTVSQFSKKELQVVYGFKRENIYVVLAGSPILPDVSKNSDLVLTKFNLTTNLYFIYIGSNLKRKNLDNMIKAFANFTKKYPQVKMVLAGSSSFDKALYSLTDDLGIQSNIVFAGNITEREKVDLFHHSIAVLFISLYEGFGLPILEAQTSSAPVLASKIDIMEETSGGVAVFCDPKDLDDITSAMDSIYKSNELKIKLVEQGKNNLKRFSWVESGSELYKLF